jgi:3-hydroxyacyl-CoA dehydrogenase
MSVRQVTVVGAETMGSGIARVCAMARYEVDLVEINGEQLSRAMKAI